MIKHICILIPSYNEGKTIGAIVRKLKDRDLPVYVVDDGSIDDTYNAALTGGATVIKNIKNLGKGAALRVGFKRVIEDGYEAVIVMDGDDQHDVTDIAHLIMKMRETGAGLIIGSRMHDTASMPYIRILVNRGMSFLLSNICGQKVPDTQCGFRLITRDLLSSITLESLNYEIESEMIIKACRAGFKVESVPIKTVYQDEVSRINPVIDTIRFLILLARMGVKR